MMEKHLKLKHCLYQISQILPNFIEVNHSAAKSQQTVIPAIRWTMFPASKFIKIQFILIIRISRGSQLLQSSLGHTSWNLLTHWAPCKTPPFNYDIEKCHCDRLQAHSISPYLYDPDVLLIEVALDFQKLQRSLTSSTLRTRTLPTAFCKKFKSMFEVLKILVSQSLPEPV